MSHLRPLCLAVGLPALAALGACSADSSTSREAVSSCDAAPAMADASTSKVCDAGTAAMADAAPTPSSTCDGGVSTVANCTHTYVYWETHNEFATDADMQIDWPAPFDENQTLCGKTLLSILQSEGDGSNLWVTLATRTITAQLNIAAGATSTDNIDVALPRAVAFLNAHCDTVVSGAPRLAAMQLGHVLANFNTGVTGPGMCQSVATMSTPRPEISTARRME